MPKKRGAGEGSIFKQKDGRWRAAITIGCDEEGNQKKKYLYGKTRQEVAEKLNQAVFSLQQGTFVQPNKVKVSEWLNTWLFQYKKPSVRPSTFRDYEGLVRVHINPIIGGILLKDLRPEQIQSLYNEKSKEGLSASTVRHIHIVLHQAFRQAKRNNLVPRNLAEDTELPKLKRPKIKVLSMDAQRKFLAVLDDERLRAAFIVAFGTGMREGELLALRWQDCNLETGAIRVEQTVQRIKVVFDDEVSTKKTELVFGEVKTEAGKRSIPLPASVLSELKAHKKRQQVDKLAAGELWTDSGLVFTTELGGVIEPRNFLRKFYQLLGKAGIEHINFHAAARHSFATRLLEANEHPKVVQEMLGHASITLTLDTYSHVLPEIKQAAAAKLDYLFQEKKPSPEGDLLKKGIK